MTGRGGAGMRMRGLVRKEFLQVLRDPSSIAIALLMPLVLLVLFGYGVSLDAKGVPVAVVVEAPDGDTMSFTTALYRSTYFRPVMVRTMREARHELLEGRVRAIVHLREDFSRGLYGRGPAPIQVIVNGVDTNTARLTIGYLEGVWSVWLARRAEAAGQPLAVPVELEQRIWYNPAVRSRDFLVPGLIAVIMTLIGALLTAMVMAREWERGTMEALLVTPVRIRELLAGKLLTYFCLGVGGMLLSITMAVWVFGIPLRGSLWLLLACCCLFLLTALGMGLLISTVAKVQFVAGQIAIIATFLPAFLLSGFIIDIHAMPPAVQAVTYVIAARYFVAILQTLFLAGNVWSIVLPNAGALALMAAVFLTLAYLRSAKSLE